MPLVPASRLPIAKRLVTIPINGGGIAIVAGERADLALKWEGELDEVVLMGRELPGDAVIDIWVGTPEQYPLTSDQSIIGDGTKPSLSAGNYASLTDFSDWITTTIPSDAIVTVSVESASILERLTVELVILSLAI